MPIRGCSICVEGLNRAAQTAICKLPSRRRLQANCTGQASAEFNMPKTTLHKLFRRQIRSSNQDFMQAQKSRLHWALNLKMRFNGRSSPSMLEGLVSHQAG